MLIIKYKMVNNLEHIVSGGSLPLILMQTRVFRSDLLGGYLSCRKDFSK